MSLLIFCAKNVSFEYSWQNPLQCYLLKYLNFRAKNQSVFTLQINVARFARNVVNGDWMSDFEANQKAEENVPLYFGVEWGFL